MPYQGSTQSVGFRNRPVPDTASRKSQSYAQALDKQRVETVNEFRRTSQSQLAEMERQDRQLTKNDAYEIENLAKFSKSLNKALKASAETVGKAYIDTKRQEGIDRARACYSGDKSACAGIDLDKEQVAEIEAKVEEMRQRSTGTADKIELEAKLKNYRLTLEERQTALNIRKLGSNVAYGYRQGLLVERAKGFSAHLKTSLLPQYDDNENRIDETIIVKDELGNDLEVRIGDFDKQSGAVQTQIIRHVERKYIEDNDGGFNRNVVNTYLTSEVVKESLAFQKITQDKAEVAQAEKEKTQIENEIRIASEQVETNPDLLPAAIQKGLNRLVSIERRLGTTNHARAARESLKKMIIAAGADLKAGSHLNIDDMEDVLDMLETHKFKIEGHGEVILSEFWKEDFNIKTIRASMLKTQTQKIRAEDDNSNLNGQIAIEEAKDEYRATGDKAKYMEALKVLNESDLNKGTKWTGMYKDALNWELDVTTTDKALSELAALEKLYPEGIPLKYTIKWPSNVVKEYAHLIVKPNESITNDDLSKQALETAHSNIASEINRISGSLNTTDRSKVQLGYGIKKIQSSVTAMVKAMKERGDNRHNSILIEEAAATIIAGINADHNGEGDGTYTILENGTFKNQLFNRQLPRDMHEVRVENDTALLRATSQINNYDGDIFKDKSKFIVPANSPLLSENSVGYSAPGQANSVHPFWTKISNEDPLERTPFELMNLERAKHGLEPIKWDQDIEKFITGYNSQNSHIKGLLRSGITSLQERGIDLAGGISAARIYSSLVGPNGESFINEEELPSLLSDSGLPNMTFTDFQNNPEAIERVQNYKINRLMSIALSKTKNKLTAIRMIAAASDLPLDQAEAAMENWNGIKPNDEIDQRTASVLNSYLSGNTANLKYVTTNQRLSSPTIFNKDNEIDVTAAQSLPIPNTLSGIDQQIAELNSNRPKAYKDQFFLNQAEKTPEFIAWEGRMEKLRAHKNVFEIMNLNSTTKWSSIRAKSSLKSILGKDKFNELVQKAGGYPSSWTLSKRNKKVVEFDRKFTNLLLALPEFSGGID